MYLMVLEGLMFIFWLVAELESEASAEQPSRLSMADPDVQFCVYMVNKYGDNYVVSLSGL